MGNPLDALFDDFHVAVIELGEAPLQPLLEGRERANGQRIATQSLKLGVDLQEAAIGGSVSIDEITDAVLRCTGCTNPYHCDRALALQNGDGRPPEYCRNQDLLARLAP